jgi:hypothetical protein
LILTAKLFCTKQRIPHTTVDSLTFVNRKSLNNLNTEVFEKKIFIKKDIVFRTDFNNLVILKARNIH